MNQLRSADAPPVLMSSQPLVIVSITYMQHNRHMAIVPGVVRCCAGGANAEVCQGVAGLC